MLAYAHHKIIKNEAGRSDDFSFISYSDMLKEMLCIEEAKCLDEISCIKIVLGFF
jgi:hypothetical protein